MKTLWDLKNDNSEFPKKGLFSLKFMQRGIESQRTKNEEMIEELEKQMIDGDIRLDSEDEKNNDEDEQDDDPEEMEQQIQLKTKKREDNNNKSTNLGRRIIGDPVTTNNHTDTMDLEDNSIAEMLEEQKQTSTTKKSKNKTRVNGPVTVNITKTQVSKKAIEKPEEKLIEKATVNPNNEKVEKKSKNKEQHTQTAKLNPAESKEKQVKVSPTEVIINTDTILSLPNLNVEETDADHGGFQLLTTSTSKEQRELIARAFASNDDAELEFEKEKQEAMEEGKHREDLDLVVLPGWNMWGGEGAKPPKKLPKFILKKQKELEEKLANAPPRKDAKLQHVIINEKRDKKAAKFTTTEVPHPFTSREQFEKILQHPLGREWNTESVYNKLIEPKVSTKAGRIIDPIKYSKKFVKQSEEKMKMNATISNAGKKSKKKQ